MADDLVSGELIFVSIFDPTKEQTTANLADWLDPCGLNQVSVSQGHQRRGCARRRGDDTTGGLFGAPPFHGGANDRRERAPEIRCGIRRSSV